MTLTKKLKELEAKRLEFLQKVELKTNEKLKEFENEVLTLSAQRKKQIAKLIERLDLTFLSDHLIAGALLMAIDAKQNNDKIQLGNIEGYADKFFRRKHLKQNAKKTAVNKKTTEQDQNKNVG